MSWFLAPCANVTHPYCNASMAPKERVADLVSRLTILEMVAMLTTATPIERPADGVMVPSIAGSECLHSAGVDVFQDNGGFKVTNFPTPIALGASFDPQLVRSVSAAVAVEARAKNNVAYSNGGWGWNRGVLCYAPVVNIARDPRWGRLQETYGEDPTMAGMLGAAYVRGLRSGNSTEPLAPPPYQMTVALVKHLDAYGGPENDAAVGPTWNGVRMGFNAEVSEIDLEETFRPAFRASVAAGALGTMCSYNAINGFPSCASDALLNGLLRGKLRCGRAREERMGCKEIPSAALSAWF